MSKPSPSRALLVVGILLCFLSALLVYVVPPLINAFFVAKDGPLVVVNFQPTIIAGLAAFVVGMIFVLVGISRAAAGIDYLVSIAREPGSGVQRRSREDFYSQG